MTFPQTIPTISTDCSRAADLLRQGKLVAIPTETVYGLGADAMNPAAVRRIFEVKGRPANHPLIVHLASAAKIDEWVLNIPKSAWQLAERFWPGPLTMILQRRPHVPDAVTGGLNTVGLRVPAHATALRLLEEFGGGIAAPSANRFGKISPTEPEHVRDDLGASIDLILDGGRCAVGIESTIIDLSDERPVILRPGFITQEMASDVLKTEVAVVHSGGEIKAPGQHPIHYAPRAKVILVKECELIDAVKKFSADGRRVAVMSPSLRDRIPGVMHIHVPADMSQAAQTLYQNLRDAEPGNVDIMAATTPSRSGLGTAIADRLTRAAGKEFSG